MADTENLELCVSHIPYLGGLALSEVKEGDVLVINLPRVCSTEVRDRAEADISARIAAKLGRNVAVLVLEPDVLISSILRAG